MTKVWEVIRMIGETVGGHRVRVDAKLLGHFLLKQAQFQTLLADMVSDVV